MKLSSLLALVFLALPLHARASLLDWYARNNELKNLAEALEKGEAASDKNAALLAAAGNGHLEAAKLLIEKGADATFADSRGDTALHLAASGGHVEVLKLLLDKGARVDARSQSGETPLHKAAGAGHAPAAKLLIDKGADTGAVDERGEVPLHKAAYEGRTEAAKLLIEKGAAIEARNQRSSGQTPLFLAVDEGHVETVALLLKKKADARTGWTNGRTALHEAALEGRVEIAKLLIEKGADVNARYGGEPVLQWAVPRGTATAELLIRKGADPNAKSDSGGTMLTAAVVHDQPEVLRLLLAKGVEVDARSGRGETALHTAAGGGKVEPARILLEKGADVNAKDQDGETPLHEAAYYGQTELAKLLLAKGAALDARDNDKRTPLFKSVAQGKLDMAQLLIEKRADLRLTGPYDSTVLHEAVARGHTDLVRLLIKERCPFLPDSRGASPLHLAAGTGNVELYKMLAGVSLSYEEMVRSFRDKEGERPLHWAASGGHLEMVRHLVADRADVNAANDRGRTPLSSALANGKLEVAKFLLSKGADPNARDDQDETLLHRAVYEGKAELVRFLLDGRAEPNVSEKKYGSTPLKYAAQKGQTELAKLLLEKGAQADAKDDNGWTPLEHAAYERHVDLAKLLMQKGADADVALVELESRAAYDERAKAAVRLLEGLKARQAPAPAAPQGVSKEDLKTIVQAAVEGAKANQSERKAAATTDIDGPSFTPAQRIMTEDDLAVIIGIEGYRDLPKSDYSYDDARLVKEYAKALGFKERNIEFLTDERATLSGMTKTLEAWLKNKTKAGSRVFVYYSGHGAPEPKSGDAYLVPYDGDPNYLEVTGYPLKKLYAALGRLPAAEIVVVLDACFSGSGGRSVLAKGARPLVARAEQAAPGKNMAVLSSTQGGDISTSDPEKGHGVFTYFFLKALKEGKTDLASIYGYLRPLVEDEAKALNVQQRPSLSPGAEGLRGRFSLRR